jgi:hypothetical protein
MEAQFRVFEAHLKLRRPGAKAAHPGTIELTLEAWRPTLELWRLTLEPRRFTLESWTLTLETYEVKKSLPANILRSHKVEICRVYF